MGLDINKFINNNNIDYKNLFINDKDIIKDVNNNHDKMRKMIQERYNKIKAVDSFWKKSEISKTLNALTIMKDLIVFITVLIAFVVLIIFSCIATILSGVVLTSTATKWSMFSSAIMPSFLKSNMTPEFTGAVFRLSSSVSNIVSPLFPYFAIFIGFLGLYSKNDFSIKKCYNLLVPFFVGITIFSNEKIVFRCAEMRKKCNFVADFGTEGNQ
jgi:p-aminobenzoyl-glutamate transporter AbgT